MPHLGLRVRVVLDLHAARAIEELEVDAVAVARAVPHRGNLSHERHLHMQYLFLLLQRAMCIADGMQGPIPPGRPGSRPCTAQCRPGGWQQ
jgi:hypothetical protein